MMTWADTWNDDEHQAPPTDAELRERMESASLDELPEIWRELNAPRERSKRDILERRDAMTDDERESSWSEVDRDAV